MAWRALIDVQWGRIPPQLPREKRPSTGDRPRADPRRCFEGILWVLWTGAPWSELSLIDDIVPGSALRDGLIKRLTYAQTKVHEFPKRRNGVYPV